MSTNPFVNALLAAGYISLLVTLIFNSPYFISDNELGMIAPVIMLSLLVLSVSLMGYLFFYQPVILLIEHKPKEATALFFRTVVSFAVITLCIALAWFLLGKLL
ncbi:MAG: hypothetical protein JWN18_95 [Parcubacteria group bacterium]|nr:hypothetical protein [Parcubacteria group bacterium]